jgi:ubiquinol-cytochrome c reductase iron-sulfur subunit
MNYMADQAHAAPDSGHAGGTRREFLYLMTASAGAFGVASVVWPFVSSLNPSQDVLALASVEYDFGAVQAGEGVTIKWQGKPLFIRRRTPEEIAKAKQADPTVDPKDPTKVLTNPAGLRDPQTDAARVQKPEWLVLVGVCTHLGCTPQGEKSSEMRGEFGGYYCPCHGSQYDTSGRIRKGPAPLNLAVPPYAFTSATKVKVG